MSKMSNIIFKPSENLLKPFPSLNFKIPPLGENQMLKSFSYQTTKSVITNLWSFITLNILYDCLEAFVNLFNWYFQDGRIDYNEFVAMMHKGNAGTVAKKGLENSFSIGFREAFKP